MRDSGLKDPGTVVTRVEKSGLYKDIDLDIFNELYVYEVAAKESNLIVYLEEDCFANMEENNNEIG